MRQTADPDAVVPNGSASRKRRNALDLDQHGRMSPSKRRDPGEARAKRCPVCHTECDVSSTTCIVCEYEFPKRIPKTRACPECDTPNALSAKKCSNCGHSFV